MPIQLTGSLEVSGSISINGSTVSTGSSGGATAEELFGSVQAEYTNKWVYTQDFTYTLSDEEIITIHVSSSAIHLVDLTSVTTSASINILYYPELLPTYSVAEIAWKLPANGSVATRGVVRTQVTASDSTEYWVTNAAPFSATSANIQTTNTNLVLKRISTSTVQPTAIIKGADNTEIVLGYPGQYSSTLMYLYSGSLGTPIS